MFPHTCITNHPHANKNSCKKLTVSLLVPSETLLKPSTLKSGGGGGREYLKTMSDNRILETAKLMNKW